MSWLRTSESKPSAKSGSHLPQPISSRVSLQYAHWDRALISSSFFCEQRFSVSLPRCEPQPVLPHSSIVSALSLQLDQQQGCADVGAPGWPLPWLWLPFLCALQHHPVQGWTPGGVCVQLRAISAACALWDTELMSLALWPWGGFERVTDGWLLLWEGDKQSLKRQVEASMVTKKNREEKRCHTSCCCFFSDDQKSHAEWRLLWGPQSSPGKSWHWCGNPGSASKCYTRKKREGREEVPCAVCEWQSAGRGILALALL